MREQNNNITFVEDRIPNTVSANKKTHTPSIAGRTRRTTASPQLEFNIFKDRVPSDAHDNDAGKEECIVKRIVRQIGEGDTVRYFLRWYGHGP